MTLKEEIYKKKKICICFNLNCFEHFSMADIDFTDTNLVTKTRCLKICNPKLYKESKIEKKKH